MWYLSSKQKHFIGLVYLQREKFIFIYIHAWTFLGNNIILLSNDKNAILSFFHFLFVFSYSVLKESKDVKSRVELDDRQKSRLLSNSSLPV